MHNIQFLGLMVAVTLAAAMPAFCTAQGVAPVDPQLQGIFSEQEAAWNRGDGKAWASSFTEDADFINIRGDVFHGQEMIAKRHAQIFGGPFQGSHATVTIRQVTELAPGVVLVETDHDVRGFKFLPPGIAATEPGVLKTRLKYVAVKQGGQWRLVAGQNTAVVPAASVPAVAK